MFEWREEYRVGVAALDEQHRELFGLMQALHEGYAESAPVKRGRAVFVRMLTDLVVKTKAHFATEEELMRRWSYPHSAEHKQVHDALVGHAEELLEKVQRRGDIGAADVIRFLNKWVAHHISAADHQLAAFLIEHDAC